MLKYAGVVEWQTRLTQNQEGNRGGSSPFTGTIFKIPVITAIAGVFLYLQGFDGSEMALFLLFISNAIPSEIIVFRTKHNTKYNTKPPGISGRSAYFSTSKKWLSCSAISCCLSFIVCWYTALSMLSVAWPMRSIAYLFGTPRASMTDAL